MLLNHLDSVGKKNTLPLARQHLLGTPQVAAQVFSQVFDWRWFTSIPPVKRTTKIPINFKDEFIKQNWGPKKVSSLNPISPNGDHFSGFWEAKRSVTKPQLTWSLKEGFPLSFFTSRASKHFLKRKEMKPKNLKNAFGSSSNESGYIKTPYMLHNSWNGFISYSLILIV